MSDRIFGLASVLLAAFYLWQATLIETSFIVDPVGPKTFPVIIGVALGLSGLYPIFKPDPWPDWPAAGRLLEVLFAVVVMLTYALVLTEVGFVVSTAVAGAILSWRLGARPVAAAIAGTTISLGIYAAFHLVLSLPLARGPWGF